MDFLKILKSLEEFIYEAAAWLFFFPSTLWRVFVHPVAMAAYADAEIRRPAEEQFRRYLSPPLFLLLAVALCHGVELYAPVATAKGDNELSALLLESEEGLLAYRTVSFAVWALCGALHSLWRTGQRIDRDTLRGPFYAQCYIAAPTAIFASLGATFIRMNTSGAQVGGLVLIALAVLYYVASQAAWIRHELQARWPGAIFTAIGLAALGSAINFGVGIVLTASG